MPDMRDLGSNGEAVAELSPRVVAKGIIDGPTFKLIVEGETRVSSWWISAPEIVFKAGGVLVFSTDAIARRRELFVVCKKLTVESGIGRITWQRDIPPIPADRGQAAAGPNGGGQGAGGSGGGAGQAGADGHLGTPAPDLSLFVQVIGGDGNLEIDFSGGTGGPGGVGQMGGTGGSGAQGSPAKQASKDVFGTTVWLLGCEAGPGTGGNGGAGGTGGNGGTGGIGGNGGTVTIGAAVAQIPFIRNMANIKNDGGAGGLVGDAGLGGQGGQGGPEGQLATFCSSRGVNSSPGATGAAGIKGVQGQSGTAGAQFDSDVTEDKFSKLFQF